MDSTCLKFQTTKLAMTAAEFSLAATQFVDERRDKTFHFSVVASRPSRISGIASQAVEVSAEPVLQVFLECLANCGHFMNPSYRLVLSAQCKVCHNMSYTWQLEKSATNAVSKLRPRDTLNGLREPVVNVNPNVFVSRLSENYTLTLSGMHRVSAKKSCCQFCLLL